MALVIFLRGVNVGGHRTFRPSILATQMKDFGCINIGAAGTFVICKPTSQARFRSELLRRLPFEADVMICTDKELIDAASAAPFEGAPPPADVVRFVTVLAKSPKSVAPTPIQMPENGRWLLKILRIDGKFAFGVYRREMKAIGCLGKIDNLLGVRATTRNWNTINSILKVLEKN